MLQGHLFANGACLNKRRNMSPSKTISCIGFGRAGLIQGEPLILCGPGANHLCSPTNATRSVELCHRLKDFSIVRKRFQRADADFLWIRRPIVHAAVRDRCANLEHIWRRNDSTLSSAEDRTMGDLNSAPC